MKKNKAILCVDDEPIVLKSLKAELSQHFGNEYVIEVAESGEEALEILDDFVADKIDTLLIISDWLMPNMKGDELLIKVHQKFPNMAKIMLSGQADASAVERVHSLASGIFISKPWDREHLKQTVSQNLST